ncbi:MAG TPA: hypothetical protein VIM73_13450 [Polyangiaceae bacterium]
MRVLGFALWGFAATFATAGLARARPSGAALQADSVIVLVFDPDRPEATSAVRAIESHIGGTGVRIVQEPLRRNADLLAWLELAQQRARSLAALGVFAIDSDGGTELRVFFSEPDGEATLIRRIRNKSSSRVALEEAGIVVHSIVESLRAGGHVGMVEPGRRDANERDEERPSGSEKARVPDAIGDGNADAAARVRVDEDAARLGRDVRRLSLGLSGVGTSWATGEGWQLGVALGLQVRLTDVLGVQLEYSWFSELRVTRDETTFAVARHPFGAWLRYVPYAGFSPLFETGGFIDIVHRRTEYVAQPLRGTTGDGSWMWGVGGRAGMTASPQPFLRVSLTAGVDLAVVDVEYVVETESSRTLLSTRSVRPQMELAVEADVW